MSKYCRGGPPKGYFPPEIDVAGLAKPLAVAAPFPLLFNQRADELAPPPVARRYAIVTAKGGGSYLIRDLRRRPPITVDRVDVGDCATRRHALALARSRLLELERIADQGEAGARQTILSRTENADG
jgi:hypothetical protein